jgi:hypothetical protein
MKFFDALIEFFTYSEKENERRWEEFLKLAKQAKTILKKLETEGEDAA